MTGKYEELKQRQTSGIMSWLSNQPFDIKLGLAWGAVAAGIVGGGMSFTGTMDAKVQFCLQLHETKLCKPSYRMPLYEWEKNRPSHAILAKTIPATNPYKPLWAGLSALGFSAAGAIFRQLQDDERQLQEFINIDEKKEVAIAQIAANAEIESHTVDQVVVIQQAELLADTEVKQLAIEQEEELFRFKTAGMSEEEIADFVRSVEPPYLTGMSLDQVNDPSDKVASSDPRAVAPITFERLEAIGNQAIDDLAYTSQSVIFLGTPGAGKSTSLGTILGRMRSKYGKGLKLYAIAMKNDSFSGAKVGQLNFNSDDCWEILSEVITELRRRALMPSSKRLAYCEANPIKLILDDYVSQQRQFETVLKDKKVEYPETSGEINLVKFGDAVDAVLSEITFNGRELCVSAIVSTQSANLTDLPFLSSKSGRASVILMVQALKNTKKKQGNYEVVSQSINNAHLIADDKERQRLREIFSLAKELSYKYQQPIILTSNSDAGEYILGIVPNLVAEYSEYEQQYSKLEPTTENEVLQDNGYSVEQLERLYQLEFNLNAPQPELNKPALTDKHKAILEYLKNNGARTLKQIADSRRLGLPETRELLKDLIQQELIEQDGESYRLPNN
jgi:hypothetical protein